MKKVPTEITPIFLWQRAYHVDGEETEAGEVEIFEYEGKTYCHFTDHDVVCHYADYEKMIQKLKKQEEDPIPICPHCKNIYCISC